MKSYPKNMITAIFDLDGTLYSGHIGHGILMHHRKQHVNRIPMYTYLLAHTALWLPQQMRLLSSTQVRSAWTRNMGWTFAGFHPEEAVQASRWIGQEYVLPLVHTRIMDLVHQHVSEGHRVVLVSGTPSPLLAGIGEVLGINETVGTSLLLKDGRYTGASEHPICQGKGKVERLLDYLGNASIDWSRSFAYADSVTDIPLLEMVGIPTAVHPDTGLSTHAHRNGWRILETRTEP